MPILYNYDWQGRKLQRPENSAPGWRYRCKTSDLLVGGESPQIPNYAAALDKYIKTPRLVARCDEVI